MSMDGRQRRQVRLFWPASLGIMLAYAAYCCLNVVASDPQLFGVFELSKVFRGIIVVITIAFYVQSERELRMLLYALCAAVAYETFLSLEQRYLFHGYRIAGSFDHPNTLSMFCCIVMPLLVAGALSQLPLWPRLVFGACALLSTACTIMTVSRMGFATLAFVALLAVLACAEFRLNSTNVALIAVMALAMTGMSFKAWDTLAGRYTERTLDEEGEEGRGIYFKMAALIARDHFLGIGLNNWSYWVTNEYASEIGLVYRPYIGTDEVPDQTIPPDSKTNGAQAAPAHNLPVLTLGELGWPGLVLFVFVWMRWLSLGAVFLVRRSPALVSRFCAGAFLAVLAVLLQSMTEWAYRQTSIFFLCNIIIGALAAVYVHRSYIVNGGQAQ